MLPATRCVNLHFRQLLWDRGQFWSASMATVGTRKTKRGRVVGSPRGVLPMTFGGATERLSWSGGGWISSAPALALKVSDQVANGVQEQHMAT